MPLTNTNFEKVVKFGPERKGKDFIYRLDCTKSKSELGWESNISLNDGLKEYTNGLKIIILTSLNCHGIMSTNVRIFKK